MISPVPRPDAPEGRQRAAEPAPAATPASVKPPGALTRLLHAAGFATARRNQRAEIEALLDRLRELGRWCPTCDYGGRLTLVVGDLRVFGSPRLVEADGSGDRCPTCRRTAVMRFHIGHKDHH